MIFGSKAFLSKDFLVWKGRLRNLFGGSEGQAFSSEELKGLLFEADLSASIVDRLLQAVKKSNLKDRDGILQTLVDEGVKIANSVGQTPVEIPVPGAILLLGVNGAGKTTVAAKLGKRIRDQGKRVVLAAADTFRAGAVEQLQSWGKRLNIEVVAQKPGADPGAVVFDAWQKAISQKAVLIADTAGRLHTKDPLLEELRKVVRVLGKDGKGAPHESYLVLDGTTGQNALSQSREFLKAAPITGLIITKLDGSARGGSALSSSFETGIPIRYIGVGEKEDDLLPFDPVFYSKELFGL